MRRILILLCLGVAGCATNPPANNVIAVTADAIIALSNEADRAEWRGWITAEQEVDIQNRLIEAVDLLDSAVALKAGQCDPPKTRNECVQDILLSVEQELREGQP